MSEKPTFVQKLISFSKAISVHTLSGLKTASEEEQVKRADICGACPELDEEKYECKICKCRLQLKISWATSSCPIGNWKEEV